MMRLTERLPVYLYREPMDFRKQINGLCLVVQDELGMNVFSESAFIFCNRARNRIKVLYWHHNGFCLWMKRLEQDKFAWPRHLNSPVVNLTSQEFQWLLEGFDIWRQPPHQRLNFAFV